MFPSDNIWNAKVDQLPVDSNSSTYISTIGASSPLHPDFGSVYGYPINYVTGSQAKVAVTFAYASESDPGPYPIPSNVNIESGSDHHAFLIDTTNCIDYELFGLSQQSNGTWTAGSGAIFPLNSDALRPAGWTSADAAGLPMIPGMVRYDEMIAGHIDHALRFTAPQTRYDAYLWPARHWASSVSGSQYPEFGQRFRLKASFDISSYPAHVQVILQALKTYGMILADNGGSWFISGLNDARFNDNELNTIKTITGSEMEAVDESSLMENVNSAQVKSTTPAGSAPTGWVNIVSKNSGMCLSVVGGSSATAVGTPLEQATCANGTNQEFQFLPVSGGYEIKIRSSSQGLDVRGGPSATANGVIVQQYTYYGHTNQIWNLTDISGNYFEILANNSGKCLDVYKKSTADHTHVQQWVCWAGANQQWSFVPVE